MTNNQLLDLVELALAGHEEEYYVGSWNAEMSRCTACNQHADWSYAIRHEDGCAYVAQEDAVFQLKQLIDQRRANDPTVPHVH